MSISMGKFNRRLLACAGTWGVATILASCGGGHDHGGHPPPPPPPAGLSYDVIRLSIGVIGERGFVGRQGMSPNGKVAGTIDGPDGRLHAFLYDGERTIDLGLPNSASSEAYAVNNLGQVTGVVNSDDGSTTAFLYDGTLRDLGSLGGRLSIGLDINDRGQVTGSSTGTDNIEHAFLYQDGALSALPTPGVRSSGRLIDESGTVAGRYNDPKGFVRGFVIGACHCPKDLGTLGGDQTFVFGINNAGQVAGQSQVASGRFHVFRYDNGTIRDVGTLGGDFADFGGINESGWVVGYSQTATNALHAFLYDGVSLRDLGTLGGTISQANAINAAGRVVGTASTATGAGRAMTWTAAGGMVDLNTLLHKPPPDLLLTNAWRIADNGWIVANANPGLVVLKPRNGQK